MIPISLTLKGIYSYQTKEQVIDFNHLSSAGLFGIFGSVGSGKSTILEAISYALYGETERLNRRENRGYNMMNLKSDQLLIDFIFKNGADNQEYRFIVKGRRNTKRFDDVKTFDRQAFKKVKNDWLPISADAAEEITGLNYVNFRRTIIIPQGRFQEFLQLGDTDRTRMMKELFQLDRFDLYDKTRGLEYKNQNQIINVEGQLQQLDEVSEERIVEITKQITDLKNLMLENQQKLKEKEAKVAEMKSLAELFEKIRLHELDLKQLNFQKPEFEKLKLQLKEYQNCLLQFKNKIEKLADDKKKYEVLTHEISAAQKQFEQLQQELEKLELTFNILKDQYAEKEVLKNEASAYSKILNIKQLKNEIQLLQGREQNGKRTLENTVGIIEKLEKERDKVRSEIQQLKNNQPDISELARIKTWYVELNNLIKELKNAELQIEGNLEKKVQHHTEIVKLAKKNGLQLKEIDNAFIHSHFANGIEALEQEKEAFELELKHLNVKHGLIQYAENLIEGEACPVCGSIHHPDKMEAADLSEKIKNYENKLKSTKENIKTFSEADKIIGKKLIEYQVVENQLNEAIEKSKELKSNIEKHNNSYQFEQKLKEEEVEKT
ncbi:MAG: SMC family ATPase, partial [Bacteroidales bacterium]|nr:SMC family ATPase [Bacteroidales bacterium]